MSSEFESGAVAPAGLVAHDWFVFRGSELMMRVAEDGALSLPFQGGEQPDGLPLVRREYIGRIDQTACIAADLPDDFAEPDGMKFTHLRQAFRHLAEQKFWIAGRAIQILDWDRTHQFCGRCGIPTTRKDTEHARACQQCKMHFYPRLSPAVIMAVTKGDDVLMARNVNWPEGRFSVLAGFVEAGETLEQTVAREVFEETGIRVKNVRYFASQPWPFPNSLMLGFFAEYESGEIVVEVEEIAEAEWFPIADLPRIPPRPSIANALITHLMEDGAKNENASVWGA